MCVRQAEVVPHFMGHHGCVPGIEWKREISFQRSSYGIRTYPVLTVPKRGTKHSRRQPCKATVITKVTGCEQVGQVGTVREGTPDLIGKIPQHSLSCIAHVQRGLVGVGVCDRPEADTFDPHHDAFQAIDPVYRVEHLGDEALYRSRVGTQRHIEGIIAFKMYRDHFIHH